MLATTRTATTRPRTTAGCALVLIALLGLVAAPASAAPVGIQASGGWYTDSDDFFLGAGARIGLASITVIPNAEWLFVDRGKAYTLNLDGTLNVLPLAAATGYVGGGLGLSIFDPDGGDSTTDTVVNLIAGVGFNVLPLKPFAHLKWVVVEGDDLLVFTMGIRF